MVATVGLIFKNDPTRKCLVGPIQNLHIIRWLLILRPWKNVGVNIMFGAVVVIFVIHLQKEWFPCDNYVIKCISDLQQVGRLFSSGTPVSSTNETDSHDITAILLKVTLKHPNRSHVFEKNLCADIHLIAYFLFFSLHRGIHYQGPNQHQFLGDSHWKSLIRMIMVSIKLFYWSSVKDGMGVY